MKKITFLLVAGIFSFCCSYAQYLGIAPEIGVNFANLKTRVNGIDGTDQARAGLKIGGVVDIGITRYFSFQPGIFYSVKGSKSDYIASQTNEAGIITTNEVSNEYRINYLEIPLNLQFKFGRMASGYFFAGGGPYIAFALSGKVTTDNITTVDRPNGVITTTDRSTESSLRIGDNANTDDIRNGDVGLNLNAGYQFTQGLFLRGNAGIGFMNIMPGGDMNNYMRNNSFALSVGYMFR